MLIKQLTNCTPTQMMGYLIKTKNDKLIVIDGGGYNQSSQLIDTINDWGGKVDMWFLTHNHSDHFGSIIEMFQNGTDIEVGGFWRNNCRGEALKSLTEAEAKEVSEWMDFEKDFRVPLHTMETNQTFDVDGVHIEVVMEDSPEITVNNPNNQSVVLKFSEGDFSILFLGDLGVEGGEKLIKTAGDKVKCTAVQTAHHGQQGVTEEVYKAIGAKYAFWSTPKWLWDNTPYGGGEPGIGPFKTPETVSWLDKLGTIHVTSFDANTVFDTETETIL